MTRTPTIPRLLLRPREAAAALTISERCLWSLTATGALPAVRIGRAKRYDPADLQRFIDSQKAGVTAARTDHLAGEP